MEVNDGSGYQPVHVSVDINAEAEAPRRPRSENTLNPNVIGSNNERRDTVDTKSSEPEEDTEEVDDDRVKHTDSQASTARHQTELNKVQFQILDSYLKAKLGNQSDIQIVIRDGNPKIGQYLPGCISRRRSCSHN